MKSRKKATKREEVSAELISRKDALKKAGKYAAVTASSMIFLLSSNKAHAASQEPEPPGGGW